MLPVETCAQAADKPIAKNANVRANADMAVLLFLLFQLQDGCVAIRNGYMDGRSGYLGRGACPHVLRGTPRTAVESNRDGFGLTCGIDDPKNTTSGALMQPRGHRGVTHADALLC